MMEWLHLFIRIYNVLYDLISSIGEIRNIGLHSEYVWYLKKKKQVIYDTHDTLEMVNSSKPIIYSYWISLIVICITFIDI